MDYTSSINHTRSGSAPGNIKTFSDSPHTGSAVILKSMPYADPGTLSIPNYAIPLQPRKEKRKEPGSRDMEI